SSSRRGSRAASRRCSRRTRRWRSGSPRWIASSASSRVSPPSAALGFLDALIGGRRKLKGVAPDRLFAITTAQVTLETGLGITSKGAAGIVFQPLPTADFASIVSGAEELLRGTAEDSDSQIESADDEFGYR